MQTGSTPGATAADDEQWHDPAYVRAAVDLLGLLQATQLVAFERLASDCGFAPSVDEQVALATMAATQVRRMNTMRDRIAELGADPGAAAAPYLPVLHDFHVKTAPSDWFESLVKAYVGDGFGTDFYREVAELLDPRTRAVVIDACADGVAAEFAVMTVRAGIAADPRLAGRLALWARRLVGEALTQSQRVAAERDDLTALLLGQVGPARGPGLAGLGELYARLTDAHTARMARLGLQA